MNIRGPVLVVMLIVVPVATGSGPVRIVQPGLWHGDEVRVESEEGWWGLFGSGDRFSLREVSLSANAAYDGLVDDEGENTGIEIGVADDEAPFLLVRGLEGLEAGPVTSQFSGFRFLYPGQSEWYSLSGHWRSDETQWKLSAVGRAVEEKRDVRFLDYSIVLRERSPKGDEVRQVLHEPSELGFEGHPHLHWAGDLDRDGKLDFIFDLTSHYNISLLTLFLSSYAEPGEIVHRVAQLRTSGC